jgi:hypothetical protein
MPAADEADADPGAADLEAVEPFGLLHFDPIARRDADMLALGEGPSEVAGRRSVVAPHPPRPHALVMLESVVPRRMPGGQKKQEKG